MNVERGMKTVQKNKANTCLGTFFCPVTECNHHLKNPFKQQKHLKQHTLKVHTVKKFKCLTCGKKFSTNPFLMAHERQCGKEFKCLECGWVFKSREALLMHGKRKGHKFEDVPGKTIPESGEKRLLPKESPKKTEQVHQSVQTIDESDKRTFTQTTQTCNDSRERLEATTSDSSSQTTFPKTPPSSYMFDDSLSIFPGSFDGSLCNMETQTDCKNMSYSQNSQAVGTSSSADPLLYSHTYTQTCDEILSELGLTDVQTQTTWPPSEFQDFLVSTETQTSFTQCLEEEMAKFTTSYTQT
ncbi:hypothetical protein DMENIID0001_040070 [Sergentomyia squamirostris]